MAHKLVKFALTELYNKPHLITEQSILPILDYVDMRNLGEFHLQEDIDEDEYDEEMPRKLPHMIAGEIGVIKIHGSLTYRKQYTMCGAVGTSYQGLLESVDEFIEAGAKTIVLDVNSGGGEAYSCFSTADEMRRRVDEAGVKLVAMVDGMSCSAAYALACVADEVIAHPNASVGSIGCLICLYNDSEALKKEGYERKFISFPKDKVPFAEDGKFTDKFISRLEKDVKTLAVDFFDHVSKYTGLSTDGIEALEAQVFNAKEALEIGLVNKVMTQQEFSEYIKNNYLTITGILNAG